jgi:hypothetical protein
VSEKLVLMIGHPADVDTLPSLSLSLRLEPYCGSTEAVIAQIVACSPHAGKTTIVFPKGMEAHRFRPAKPR